MVSHSLSQECHTGGLKIMARPCPESQSAGEGAPKSILRLFSLMPQFPAEQLVAFVWQGSAYPLCQASGRNEAGASPSCQKLPKARGAPVDGAANPLSPIICPDSVNVDLSPHNLICCAPSWQDS